MTWWRELASLVTGDRPHTDPADKPENREVVEMLERVDAKAARAKQRAAMIAAQVGVVDREWWDRNAHS